MSGFSAAATYNIAYNTVLAQPIERIKATDVSLEDWNRFYKSILRAAKSVPSTLGGGRHGHAYLVKDVAGYKRLTGKNIVQQRMKLPDKKATIDKDDTAGIIANKSANCVADNDTYYTQEGTYAGLKATVEKHVPKQLIKELEDEEDGFEGVELWTMLEHIRNQAQATDFITVEEALKERNEAIDFGSEETLTSFFQRINHLIKVLKGHNVHTSTSELIARYVPMIARHGGTELNEALDAWEQSSVDKTNKDGWKEFKETFSKADRKRRRLIKARGDVNMGGRSEANHVREDESEKGDGYVTRDEFHSMCKEMVEALAEGTGEAINAAIGQREQPK